MAESQQQELLYSKNACTDLVNTDIAVALQHVKEGLRAPPLKPQGCRNV